MLTSLCSFLLIKLLSNRINNYKLYFKISNSFTFSRNSNTHYTCREFSCLQHHAAACLITTTLFVGMSISNLKSLQRAQSTLVSVVLRCGKFERITPALIDLQWLPMRLCNTVLPMYKLATRTYSIKQSGQPSYLHELPRDMNYRHSKHALKGHRPMFRL